MLRWWGESLLRKCTPGGGVSEAGRGQAPPGVSRRGAGAGRSVSLEAAEISAFKALGLWFRSCTPLGTARQGHIPRRLENAGDVNVPCLETSLGAASPATVPPLESVKRKASPVSPRAFDATFKFCNASYSLLIGRAQIMLEMPAYFV